MTGSLLNIDDKGTISATRDKLQGVGDERLIAWIRWSLGAQSDEFVDYVRNYFLSGQRLNAITGTTRDHVDAWLQKKTKGKKNQVFLIRPGVGIDGMQNYLERWTGTRHEFMRPAFRMFSAGNRISRRVEENIARQLRKVENEE